MARPTVSKSISEAAAQITRHDRHWGDTIPSSPALSYGFRTQAATYDLADHNEESTFVQFTPAQMNAAILAVNLWADVANIALVNQGYSGNATFLFGSYRSGVDKDGDAADGSSGFAGYPGIASSGNKGNTAIASQDGDVWINLDGRGNVTNASPAAGNAGFFTLIHEFGHALGLEHPGDYNAGYGRKFNYDPDAKYIEDTRQYTVMSYFSETESGASFGNIRPSTPLLHDIAAIQRLYGVNTTTHAGDTVYGFNSNSFRSVFHITSAAQQVVFAIWDVSGNDTLDFSGYSNLQTINLGAGEFSNVGGLVGNVAIAAGVQIENAIGGSGRDTMNGNELDNRLEGRGGGDTLNGGLGYDTLVGSDGDDTYILTDVVHRIFQGPIFSFEDTRYDTVVEAANGGFDTVQVSRASDGSHQRTSYTLPNNVEKGEAIGAGNFDLTGNGLANILTGNAGENRLQGMGDADILDGGAGYDTLEGGAGDDIYYLNDVTTKTFAGGGLSYTDAVFDLVIEAADAGIDTVHVGRAGVLAFIATSYTLPANVENGVISGTQSFTLSGNDLPNVLNGNAAANTINGGGGADTILGGGGNDTIDGGADIDTAIYLGSRSTFRVQTKAEAGVLKTFVVGSAETDTLTNVEKLLFLGVSYDVSAQANLTSNVDGGRYDDLVYRSNADGKLIFLNVQEGAAAGFDTLTAPLTAQWKAVGTGDVTGDGKADAVIWNSATGQVLSVQPGASGAPTYGQIADGIAGNYTALDVADINGDGFTDLLVRENSSGSILWQSMANGQPSGWAFAATNLGAAWSYQAASDVNHDGFADVAIRSTSGQVAIANMAGGRNAGYIDLGNLTGFHVRAIADVNADGFGDVILQRASDGWTVWRNLSGSGDAWNVATDALGSAWILRDTADVDNDGSVDLVYQHTGNGQTIVRAMDSGIGTDWIKASDPMGTDWLLV